MWGDADGQTTPYLLGVAGNQVLVTGGGNTPYTAILTAQQLQAINNNLTGDYVLGNSIDASGLTNFSPIGETTTFTGDFNGLGYTIANLTIDDTSDTYVGLFGQIGVGGTVENLGLTGDNVTGSAEGADVGGLAGSNSGMIENAYATGTVIGGADSADVGGLAGFNEGMIETAYATGTVTGNYDVGGLVAANDGTIEDAYATGAVTGGAASYVGGLVGYNLTDSTIEDAYATGAVTGGAASYVGGLVGLADGTITYSYATGVVSGSGEYVGGLVGENNADGKIEDAYATGAVSSSADNAEVGGLVGYNNTDGTIEDAYATGAVSGSGEYVGGLVGWQKGGMIEDAYATGAVSGSGTYVGGLVGYNTADGTIEDAYATGAVTGGAESYVGGLVGYNRVDTIEDAYATGAVSGGTATGGLVGDNDGGTYTNDYFDTTTSGTTTGVGGSGSVSGVTGLTTAEWLTEGPMVPGSANTFVNANAWVEGYPYPVLAALPYLVITGTSTETYGSAPGTVTVTSITDQNGDDASGLVDTSGITWISTATNTSDVGSYILGGSDATVTGYQVIYEGTDTVTQASLTITADNESQTYGSPYGFTGTEFTANGLVNGDSVTGVTFTSTGDSATADVGSYDIAAAGATGSGLSNYDITYEPGALTVNPAALTITADNESQTYGSPYGFTGTEFTANGLVNGDLRHRRDLHQHRRQRHGRCRQLRHRCRRRDRLRPVQLRHHLRARRAHREPGRPDHHGG